MSLISKTEIRSAQNKSPVVALLEANSSASSNTPIYNLSFFTRLKTQETLASLISKTKILFAQNKYPVVTLAEINSSDNFDTPAN